MQPLYPCSNPSAGGKCFGMKCLCNLLNDCIYPISMKISSLTGLVRHFVGDIRVRITEP